MIASSPSSASSVAFGSPASRSISCGGRSSRSAREGSPRRSATPHPAGRRRRRGSVARPPTPERAPLPFGAVISTNQFKNGTHIDVEGTTYRIMGFQHVKPGKGGAFVRTRLRKLGDGSVIDKTFRAGEKFRPVRTETRKMQYLYDAGDAAVFMDTRSYEQLEVSRALAEGAMSWMRPNDEVDILFVDER